MQKYLPSLTGFMTGGFNKRQKNKTFVPALNVIVPILSLFT